MSVGQRPSFGKAMGAFWLYTLLRFGIFFVLWGIFYVLGLGWLMGGVIAVFVSIPLSLVLLARPRAAFARTIEARVSFRHDKRAHLDAQLQGAEDDPSGETKSH